jgi:hypothetical protein
MDGFTVGSKLMIARNISVLLLLLKFDTHAAFSLMQTHLEEVYWC